MFLYTKSLCKRFARTLSLLRQDAGQANTGIMSLASAVLGFASDFLKHWFDVLGWLFPVSLAFTLLSYLVWRRSQGHYESAYLTVPKRRRYAAMAFYGLVGCVTLTPIVICNVAIGDDDGAFAEIVPAIAKLQKGIDKKFERIERALAVLRESSERQEIVLTHIQDSSEHQEIALTNVQNTMDMSVAMALVDRARSAQDGSNQGQARAVEALIARGFSFSGSDFSGVSLTKAILDGADFSSARLHFLNLHEAKLRGTKLSDSGLRFATATGADFSGADLSGVFAPFFEAPGKATKFAEAKLIGANFFGADLQGVNLSNADLCSASFAFADLRGAILKGADLTGAYFIGALLQDADLQGAIFKDTDMLGVALDPSALTNAQRTGVCRHKFSGHELFRIDLLERWPSSRFSTGYEFEDIGAYLNFPLLTSLRDLSLPVCATTGDRATGFDAKYPTYLGMHLDRRYLEKAGRRQSALARVKAFGSRLGEGQEAGPLFVLEGPKPQDPSPGSAPTSTICSKKH